jgi:hypothetical protein
MTHSTPENYDILVQTSVKGKNRKRAQMRRRVAHNGESAPCTNIQESPVTPGKKVSRKAPPVTVSPTASPSVRTLILGIDRTGQIVQHDRTAPKILAPSGDDLIGVHLTDITATPSKDGGIPVSPDKGVRVP